MTNKPFISIIITNKNARKWLDRCFGAIYAQTYANFEVIFVDNDSTDDSLDFVRTHFPKVKIVTNLEDYGFARANNIGVSASSGDYVFLLNTDTFMDPDTLEKAATYIQNHPKHHLLQLDIRKYDKSNMEGEACIFGMDRFGYPIWKGKGEPFYADGAAVILERKLFYKLQGFDEDFYMYLEDLDLAWRARLCGESVHLIEKAYVYHFAGGTSASTQNIKRSYTTSVRRRYDAQKNNLRSILKNYEGINVFWIFPISCLLASGEGFLYLLKGNFAGFLALHNSIIWNITHIGSTLRKRKKMQRIRTLSDQELFRICDSRISKLHSFSLYGVPSMNK